MCNSRMQIYCKKCLSYEFIGNYWTELWDIRKPSQEFLDLHIKCFSSTGADLFCGDNMFGMRCDSDDDGYMTDLENNKLVK